MTPEGISFLTSIYLGLFAGGIAFFWLWEDGAPLKPFAAARDRRRHLLVNFGVLAAVVLFADLLVGTWLLRIGDRLLEAPHGLLTPLGLPLWALAIVGLVIMDLVEYWVHRFAHRWRPFWLIHSAHHSDPHVDFSTGARHHPLDTTVSLLVRFGLYLLLGLPIWIELIRAILVNVMALWQHANVSAPRVLEALRAVLVTPAVHRIHHVPDRPLIDRNYGQILSVWDRLFGTYAEPAGDLPAAYGLRKLVAPRWQDLPGVLLTPLRARSIAGPL
jgi:sterol desaturase/sphingolipid hydroxylase (fatty acid hydroxylase superfamily)